MNKKLNDTLKNIEELKDELMSHCNDKTIKLAKRATTLHNAPNFLKEHLDSLFNLKDCCPTLRELENNYHRERYQIYEANHYLWMIMHIQKELNKYNKVAEELTEEEFEILEVSNMDAYRVYSNYTEYKKFLILIEEIVESCLGSWQHDW